jgi:hypothetical protein
MNVTIVMFLVQDGVNSGAIYPMMALALVPIFAVTRVPKPKGVCLACASRNRNREPVVIPELSQEAYSASRKLRPSRCRPAYPAARTT